MPTPDFILRLREKVGHDQLFVPSCTAIIVRPVPEGAPIWEVPTALLVKRSDNGKWTPVQGICEPGEEASDAAVRETAEEVGLAAIPEALLGVGKVGPVTYLNGDECMFMDTAVRLSVTPDVEPVISDDENTEARWFSVAQLPQSVDRKARLLIADGVAQMRHPRGFKPRMGYHKR